LAARAFEAARRSSDAAASSDPIFVARCSVGFQRHKKPSANPHGLMAGIAVMIAVCAMAIQYALVRLALPKAVSTAVMTGNLTNTVLSLMDKLSPQEPLMPVDRQRLKSSLHLLIGFLVGCIVAAAAISLLGDWAWSIPTVLAAFAIAVR
jgi:uncharacterized membrane protein YoaK (UPF0700 family)